MQSRNSWLLVLFAAFASISVAAVPVKAECRRPQDHEAILARALGNSTLNPVFVDGEMVGQRIVSLDSHSLLAAAGALVGDTITVANDFTINRPSASAELICLLGTTMPLKIHIDRGGYILSITLFAAA